MLQGILPNITTTIELSSGATIEMSSTKKHLHYDMTMSDMCGKNLKVDVNTFDIKALITVLESFIK